jgi:GYF domain 2
MGAGDLDGAAVWHVARDRKQYGPYQFAILAEAARKGVVARDDLIWRPGWESWQAADSVAELFAPIESSVATPTHIRPEERSASTAVESTAEIQEPAPAAGKTEKQKSSRNYLVRHWRGELSLAVSYWLNGLLVVLAAIAAGVTLSSLVDGNHVTAGVPMAAALTCFTLVIALLSIWQLTGTWRSATRYAASGKRFWGTAAKVAVVLGVIRSATDLGSMYVPIISEHMKIAMGDPRMGENKFRVLRNGTELEFIGGIKTGSAKEFERMLDAASQVRVVHLNSFGGRISEADLMAREVRKRRLITYVSDRCESACTHVFLAGHERWVGERGKIGFHQPNIPGLEAKVTSELVEKERRDLLSMGLPRDFVAKALSTPSDKIWRPTSEELLAARVISGVSDGSRFASSGHAVLRTTYADASK